MSGMNVRVNPKMAAVVEQELANGDYASASDVVDDALLLFQHEREREREKRDALRREIDLGLDDVRNGRFSTRTAKDIAEAVLRGDED